MLRACLSSAGLIALVLLTPLGFVHANPSAIINYSKIVTVGNLTLTFSSSLNTSNTPPTGSSSVSVTNNTSGASIFTNTFNIRQALGIWQNVASLAQFFNDTSIASEITQANNLTAFTVPYPAILHRLVSSPVSSAGSSSSPDPVPCSSDNSVLFFSECLDFICFFGHPDTLLHYCKLEEIKVDVNTPPPLFFTGISFFGPAAGIEIDAALLAAIAAAQVPVWGGLIAAGIIAGLGIALAAESVPDIPILLGIAAIIVGIALIPVVGFAAAGVLATAIGGFATVIMPIACPDLGFVCTGAEVTATFLSHPGLRENPLLFGEVPIGWSKTIEQLDAEGRANCHWDILTSSGLTDCSQQLIEGSAGINNQAAETVCGTGQIVGLGVSWDGDFHPDLGPVQNRTGYLSSGKPVPINITSTSPSLNKLVQNQHDIAGVSPQGLSVSSGGELGVEIPLGDRANFGDMLSQLRIGQVLRVCGPWVTDTNSDELWNEIHPVYNMTILKPPGMIISPSTMIIVPGSTGNYGLTVTNQDISAGGTAPREQFNNFAVSGLPAKWQAQLAANTVDLNAGDSTTVNFSVTPLRDPSTTPGDYSFTVTGEAASGRANGFPLTNSTSATVHVPPFSAPAINIAPVSQQIRPGQTATYTITVQNMGNVADSIDLQVAYIDFGSQYRAVPTTIQTSWATLGKTHFGPLSPGQTDAITLSITVPSTWQGMDNAVYSFQATVTSMADPTAQFSQKGSLTVGATKQSKVQFVCSETSSLTSNISPSTIPPSLKLSLLAQMGNAESKCQAALAYLLGGNSKLTNNVLESMDNLISAFTNLVQAQTNKNIPVALAGNWLTQAQTIINDIQNAIATS